MIRDTDAASTLDRLAIAAQSGDDTAFTALMQHTIGELRAFLSVRVSSVEMLEEAVQSTYVRCFERIGRYQPRCTFLSWLKGIGRHVCLELLREHRRFCQVEGQVLEGLLTHRRLAQAELESGDPDERGQRLERCLQDLSATARGLIRLRYESDKGPRAIAEELARSPNWVAVTLHRIREQLRRCIERHEARV